MARKISRILSPQSDETGHQRGGLEGSPEENARRSLAPSTPSLMSKIGNISDTVKKLFGFGSPNYAHENDDDLIPEPGSGDQQDGEVSCL